MNALTQAEFKKKATRLIAQSKSAIWAYATFLNCTHYVELVALNVGKQNADYPVSAFSKALIVDYCKVFSSDSRPGFSLKFLTKDAAFDSAIHQKIDDMRNAYVAHSDVAYEPQGHTLFYFRLLNANTQQKVKQAELPLLMRTESLFFMGLHDPTLIAEIKSHLTICKDLCMREAESNAKHLAELCLANHQWASVLENSIPVATTHGEHISPELGKKSDDLFRKAIKGTKKHDFTIFQIVLDVGIKGVGKFEDDDVQIVPITSSDSTSPESISYKVQFKR